MQQQRQRAFIMVCWILTVMGVTGFHSAQLVEPYIGADAEPSTEESRVGFRPDTATGVSESEESATGPLRQHPKRGASDQPNPSPQARLPTTPAHFFLAGTQPGTLMASIPDPEQCDTCHTAPIYDSWRGSMMANAGRDPLFLAALAVANADAAFSGEFCIRCHMPKGWFEGRSQPTDGSALNRTDIDAGVACEVCHRMVDPVPSTSSSDQAQSIDATIRAELTATVPITNVGSGMMILDPNDNRRGPFRLTGAPHSAYQTDFLGQTAGPVTVSRQCATCHTIDNPALVWTENPPEGAPAQFWPKAVDSAAAGSPEAGSSNAQPTAEVVYYPIETTYDEWRNSAYPDGVFAPQFAGDKPDEIVASCQDCHMVRSTGKAADIGNAVTRDCQSTGCLPAHTLVGGNTWVPQLLQDTEWRLHTAERKSYLDVTTNAARTMLQRAATISATLTVSGTTKVAHVRVTNQSGHKLPTGYAEGRRMWLNLKGFDESGTLVYESGAYDRSTGILSEDAESKVYEVKQGLTPEMAALVDLTAGPSFHFVLNNTVYKDNRIPPRGYTVAGFDQPGLRPVEATFVDGQYWDDTNYRVPNSTTSIQVTLYYQTASKEYIDFLRSQGGSDGVALGKLWDKSKSPPEAMAVTTYPIYRQFLPLVQQ